MTLVLAMNAPNAVCMSVDYRVTHREDGSVLDPFAIKSLVIQTSMDPGGPIALIGYAGLARLWGGLPMGSWLRATLRGECQSLFDLMDHLLSQLNRKIARFNQVLVINVLMVSESGGERYFGAFSNTEDRQTAKPNFSYGVSRIDKPQMFANGSGCEAALTPPYVDMMRAHVAGPDRSSTDHMTLLATINRQVAEADPDGPVSPYSFVTCVGSDTEWRPSFQAFHEPGETPPPFHLPWIVCGIDFSNPAEQMVQHFRDGTHPTLDEDQIRRNLDRRP